MNDKKKIKLLRLALCPSCGMGYKKVRRGVHTVPEHDRPRYFGLCGDDSGYYERCLYDEALYGRAGR